MADSLLEIVVAAWSVLGEMAPYLLLGFLVAGVLSVWLSAEWLERHLGGRGAGPVWKAALFGVPLPLCSCGVIPVGASLRRHGASRAATTSFLLSTPQTGVDSILVTHAMLGPLFAIYRPVVALLTGLVGGGLVQLVEREGREGRDDRTALTPGGTAASAGEPAACTDGCCAADAPGRPRILRALEYGFATLPRDIGTALLVGVVLAGLITALVPPAQLRPVIGGGILSILILMAAGVPLYVCATASVPIAAGFIHLGASPGAALAFLIAGPATNAATITTVTRVLGTRTAVVYLATVAAAAVGCGALLDWLVPLASARIPALGVPAHVHEHLEWWQHGLAAALLLVLGHSYLHRRRGKEDTMSAAAAGSGRIVLDVEGMTCSHCQESVRRALAAVDGVTGVEVDLAGKRAVVAGRDLDGERLCRVVDELGYRSRVAAA
jgi:uncharacterized membrane protein YraQ (UPF0718 family)/copper chaperone CopZ